MRTIVFIMISVLGISGCGSGSSQQVATLGLSPNPASVQAGVCVTQAQIVGTQTISSTLVSLVATFPGAQDERVQFTLSGEALAAVVDQIYVPASGVATLQLSFDLGAEGVSWPTEGTILLTGVSSRGSVQFVGTLACIN